jgi:pSer/pThr/pTyr-binding forkhead associated (FHA) protein
MATETPHIPTTAAGATERIDVIARLDERNRRRATGPDAAAPGRYLEVQGAQGTLLVPLSADVTHVGRGRACDLHLDDRSVSRRHALIVQRGPAVRILDDRSANGTLVNGLRVTQADLTSGDVILLGRVALRYLELPLPEGSRASADAG